MKVQLCYVSKHTEAAVKYSQTYLLQIILSVLWHC